MFGKKRRKNFLAVVVNIGQWWSATVVGGGRQWSAVSVGGDGQRHKVVIVDGGEKKITAMKAVQKSNYSNEG